MIRRRAHRIALSRLTFTKRGLEPAPPCTWAQQQLARQLAGMICGNPGGFPLSASRRASADGPQWLNGQNLSPYGRVSFTLDGCTDEDYFHSGRPADSGGPCTVINTCIEARHIPPSPSFLTPFQESRVMPLHVLRVSPPRLVCLLSKVMGVSFQSSPAEPTAQALGKKHLKTDPG